MATASDCRRSRPTLAMRSRGRVGESRAVPDVLGAVGDLREVVEATPDEIKNLVCGYIERGALSGRMRADAEHIAAAAADVLASWYLHHPRRVRQYNELNRQNGVISRWTSRVGRS